MIEDSGLQSSHEDTKEGRQPCGADFQVCCIAGFQTRVPSASPMGSIFSRPADLEIGDTAGLETCATPDLPGAKALGWFF